MTPSNQSTNWRDKLRDYVVQPPEADTSFNRMLSGFALIAALGLLAIGIVARFAT